MKMAATGFHQSVRVSKRAGGCLSVRKMWLGLLAGVIVLDE